MSKILPANRVAALAAFITGLAGAGTSLAQVWPTATTNEIALIAGGIATLAGPLAHIVGSWLWQSTPAGQATLGPSPIIVQNEPGTPADEIQHGLDPEPPGAVPDIQGPTADPAPAAKPKASRAQPS